MERYGVNPTLVCMNMDRSVVLSQACSRHHKDLTADIKTIFTRDERTDKDGTVKKGHWCEICCKYVTVISTLPSLSIGGG
jgi:hypothetical protein